MEILSNLPIQKFILHYNNLLSLFYLYMWKLREGEGTHSFANPLKILKILNLKADRSHF